MREGSYTYSDLIEEVRVTPNKLFLIQDFGPAKFDTVCPEGVIFTHYFNETKVIGIGIRELNKLILDYNDLPIETQYALAILKTNY